MPIPTTATRKPYLFVTTMTYVYGVLQGKYFDVRDINNYSLVECMKEIRLILISGRELVCV
ncbi:MAG: hypothetical protein DRJ40_07660 [Thermoprotei archaeon]|nr:MAG: hypothetical protein DRJ40_07660 [Thermoprotei archaeon]